MKTLSVTEARRNLTRWLKQAGEGQDIGIVCGDKIVALRPVTVYSEDHALVEYGVTEAELTRFADKMDQEVAAEKKTGKLRRYSGNLLKDLRSA
jgi:antitoxin (DNA-binding transcriptional repressor) of toxin-antitoxin stability system